MRATLVLACFAFSTLQGCPDETSSVADAGGVTDAAVPETEAPPIDAGAAVDGATVERKATLVFAAPDMPPQYICLGGFTPDGDGAPTGDPVHARGPFGVPDPSDPAGLKLLSGFPYGAVVPFPIRVRDAEFFDTLAPIGFVVDDVSVKAFAGFGVDSQTCKDAYAAAKGNPARTATFKRGALARGQSWLLGLVGCKNASSAPECGGGNNLRLVTSSVDLALPSSYAGAGDAKLGIQIANLAEFAGYQDVDVYLQPMRPDDAGPDGTPILLAGPLSVGDLAATAVGVQIAQAATKLTLLLVVKHGTAPFCGGQPDCTTTIPLPIQPFVDKYGPVTGAAWSQNQVFALFGRPPLGAGEKPSDFLRLGVFAAAF